MTRACRRRSGLRTSCARGYWWSPPRAASPSYACRRILNKPARGGDILADHAEAGRAYDAPYHGPDILTSGEMSMVNKDMDLMERKYCDRIELRRWADALIEAAGGQKW
jgi:hypothetical protein